MPGVAIGIIRQGEVVAAKGYGYANLEDRAPVTAQSVFQSGSVGKQFTAVAVMLQVEDGKLGLEDPITKYFTDAPPAWRQITVRNLLNHTSGIADYTDVIDLRRDFSEEELTRAAYRLPLQFTAGSKWKYSNTGYALLGFLIHKVSGRFYGDVLHDRVFVPLGMKTARIISEEDIVPESLGRVPSGEWRAQEPGMGGSDHEHDGGRRALSERARLHRLGSRFAPARHSQAQKLGAGLHAGDAEERQDLSLRLRLVHRGGAGAARVSAQRRLAGIRYRYRPLSRR